MVSKRKQKEKDMERLRSSIQLNIEKEDPRLFQNQEKKRITVGREGKIVLLLGGALIVIFFLSVFCILDLTLRRFSIAWLLENMKIRMESIVDLFSGAHVQTGMAFFLVQFVSVMLCGAALSASAAIYQGVFHNPMASPTLLGVQSGGTLGQTVYSLYFIMPSLITVTTYDEVQQKLDSQTVIETYAGQLFVLAGCFLAVFIVVSVSTAIGGGRVDTVAMILSGSVLTSVINIVIQALKYNSQYMNGSVASVAASSGLMATFSAITSPRILAMMAVPMIPCLVLACVMGSRINMIVFGEEEAKTMGMNVTAQRNLLIIVSTVLTSFVIAFCGQVAFIGLVAAVAARRLVGPDYRYLLPSSIFIGGSILIISFDVNYAMGFAYDTGSVVSLLGGVFFMIIMTANRRKRNAEWA